MATGWDTQLTKQIGEYTAAAELARRGYMSTTFSGGVPLLDIISVSQNGVAIPVQVKTIRGSSWQFKITDFAEVEFDGDRQILRGNILSPKKDLLCIFIKLDQYGSDRFFIFDWQDLQSTVVYKYSQFLERNNNVRPKQPSSLQATLSPDDLKKYEDNWVLVDESFKYSLQNRGI